MQHPPLHDPPVSSPAFRLSSAAEHAQACTPNTLRRSTLHALTLLCAATLFTHAAFAAKPPPPPPQPPSSGDVVLDWLYPGGTWAENWGLTVAPSGTIYASGNANDVDPHGIVLASSDSGSSWSLVDDFAPPGRSVYYWDFGGGIASDPAGNLYVTVTTYDYVNGIEPDLWYVRRSTDGGTTWTTVDEFPSGGIGECCRDVTGVTVDAAGDVYVTGRAKVGGGSTTWTVRKGAAATRSRRWT
jgi:hypothetical protein